MSYGNSTPPGQAPGQSNPLAGGPGPYSVNPDGIHQSPASSSMKTIWIILGVALMGMLMCGGVLVALLVPAVSAAREAANRMHKSNNMKQVGLGMHNYHAAYDQLPFTICENSSGEPTIGWRLAIAPFVEGQPQWEAVNSDEPWDGPNNQLIADKPPSTFQAMDAAPGMTNIFVIVGPDTLFPPTPLTKVGFRDTLDGLAVTVMAIELPNRETQWSSTKNLTLDEAFAAIGELEPPQVAHFLMGDGAVRAVTSSIDRTTFDALVTRAGGEQINTDF